MKQTMSDEQVQTIIDARFAQSTSIPTAFFAAESEKIARACWAMARRFHQGGRLLAFGNGSWATDAQHVAVEFVHPVIVGKRALPALALTNDSATMSGLMSSGDATMPFAHQLRALGRPQDIALGFSPDGNCRNVAAALEQARHQHMLTLGLAGGSGGLLRPMQLDFCFVVPAQDPMV
ncbi:MAG TPA: SIS domain-containing protein, partial [Ktedonobacteraceae bacterium]